MFICCSIQRSTWLATKDTSSVLVFFSEKELRSHTLAMALELMRKRYRAVSWQQSWRNTGISREGLLQCSLTNSLSSSQRPVVKMILESKDWRQALRFCEIRDDRSDSDDPNEGIEYEQCSILHMCLDPDVSGNTACKETTPFRELIKEMPG